MINTVVAALLHQEKGLLICQRSATGEFPGKWEFPGGKIEPGENASTALRRELKEELGIVAEIGEELWRVEHQYAGRSPVLLLFFAVQEYAGAIENRVFQQIEWAKPSELADYDFLEADRILIEKLEEGEIVAPSCERSA